MLGSAFEQTIIDQLLSISPKRLFVSKVDYVHTYFPSVRQLLPTFDFLNNQLLGEVRNVLTHTWQNDLLPDLNNRSNITRLKDGINTKIFASEGLDTLTEIKVTYPNLFNLSADPAGSYPDGHPDLFGEVDSSFGDGTVLVRSAQLPEANIPLQVITKTDSYPEVFFSHTNLPNTFFNQVSEFLGTPSNVTDLYSPTLPKEILAISLASPAELLVIDPNGNKLGFDNTTQTEQYGIPNGVYSGRDEIELAAIIDPLPGEYKVQITGNGTGEFHTGITYGQDECPITANQDNTGNTSGGQTTTFTIGLIGICSPDAAEYFLDVNVDVDPNFLNLSSNGNYVTGYIELPESNDVSEIDRTTIKIYDSVEALSLHSNIGDYDKDGILDLMIKFRRSEVQQLLSPGENELELSGFLKNGTEFKGKDVIYAK
jgi:hypothetical protein